MIYDECSEFNGMVISFPLTDYFKKGNPTRDVLYNDHNILNINLGPQTRVVNH